MKYEIFLSQFIKIKLRKTTKKMASKTTENVYDFCKHLDECLPVYKVTVEKVRIVMSRKSIKLEYI